MKKYIVEYQTLSMNNPDRTETDIAVFDSFEEGLEFSRLQGVDRDCIFEVDAGETSGIFTPAVYPRFVKEGGVYVDKQKPLPDIEVEALVGSLEDASRAKLYAANDPLVLPVLRTQIAALPEGERGEYVIMWEIMAAMPSEYKGAEVAKLYKALAALPEKSKTDEFKELERRRAEIRAQTAIDVTAMIGGE